MKRSVYLAGTLLAAALLASGCGGGNDNNDNANAASPQAGQANAGGNEAITITAKNFEFDRPEIKVKKGDTVSITLKNGQGMHSIKIDGYDQEIKKDKTVTFAADKAGEFKFYCATQCGAGHGDMTGTLIVE